MPLQYSGKENLALESDIDARVQELLSLIRTKYLSTLTRSAPMDLGRKIQYFTLDVISYLGFGEAIGFLANDQDMYQYVHVNDTFFPILAVILNMPWLYRWFRMWPLSLAMPKASDESGVGRIMGSVALIFRHHPPYLASGGASVLTDLCRFASALVDRRLASDAEPGKDMIQAHIRNGLTRAELKAEVMLEL